MKNKFIFAFIVILILFLSISAISADENVTSQNIELDDFLSQNKSVNINKSSTTLLGEDKVSYVDYDDEFSVKLTSNQTVLSNKQIKFVLNEVTYDKITDVNGIASLNFKLKSGNYMVYYSFAGDEDYAQSNGTSTLTVSNDLITSLSVVDEDIYFREGLKSLFQIKLTDIYNIPLKSKQIILTVDGKTYSDFTNSDGIATFYLSLTRGTHILEFSFHADGGYVSSSGTFKINVKSKLTKGHGYWVNMWDMNKVNLKKIYKLGTKHIFLQHTVFSKYGVNKVLNWIKKAHKYRFKVHIWMVTFYKNGKFIHPVNKKGVYNYKYMNKIINKAKYYAGLKGVDGIHFDYMRYGGNAYKYKNAADAINYFAKKSSIILHSLKEELIFSSTVMPEPNSMKHYYGQDVSFLSKYMDVIIPMIYKGNYHAGTKWIKTTTKKFTKITNGAQIWAGIQTYKSDANVKKLSYKKLFKDAKAAKNGGAGGIVLFRWGITKFINFKKL